jgi:hypothetical protein
MSEPLMIPEAPPVSVAGTRPVSSASTGQRETVTPGGNPSGSISGSAGPSGAAPRADVARLGARAEHADQGMPAAEGVAPLAASSSGCPASAGQSAVGTAAGIPTLGAGRCPSELLARFTRRRR